MIDLFPCAIHHEELNLDVSSIAKFCLDEKEKSKGVVVSNIGGWQSAPLKYKGENESVNQLFSTILESAKHYQKEIGIIKPLGISTIWININEYKDSNMIHFHPEAQAAGVFYVKANPISDLDGALNLIHPCQDRLAYDWTRDKFSETNKYNEANCLIAPKENNIVLFPSWLKHSVLPNLNKEEKRISFSFNLG